MPTISCEVKHCHYNKDGGCRLEGVKVEGENASVYEETMCDSFTNADTPTSKNSTCDCEDCACSFSDVECTAENCVYNENGYCDADKITVGCADARTPRETECKTFEEK